MFGTSNFDGKQSTKAQGASPANRLMSTTALATVLLSLLGTQVALAQARQEAAAPDVESVVVTGSHIVRDGYAAPTPVTVLGADMMEKMATVSIAESVNRLPELAGSVTPTSSAGSISQGSAGLNNLNLRGLGADRTLVLMDSKRLVGASFNTSYSNGGSVDVNVMPAGLVSRVDVVTGGASAAYGSDAVAGVVNFVLDHNFEGIKGDFQGGVSSYGDNQSYKGSLVAGTSFAGGRGHIEFDAEYFANSEIGGKARPWTNAGTEIVVNPKYAAGNGLPQYLIAQHAGLSTGAPGGVISSGPLANTAFGPGGAPFTLNYDYTSGMNLVGGDWQFTRIDNQISLVPAQSVGVAFVHASYALTDNVELYGEAHWASSRTTSRAGLAPSYFNNLTVSAGNPFIPASVAAGMTANGLTSITMGTWAQDLNGIGFNNTRIFQRYMGGLDGHFDMFGSTWAWNASFEHSGTNTNNRVINDPITANLKQAIDAVTGPNGTPVCRNPAGGCVPYNPFGLNVNSQAAINYVRGTGYLLTQLKQDAADLSISGEPFSNWAGPVSLAAGGNWRRESVGGDSSALDKAGAFNFGNYKPGYGSYDVTEGFLEVVLPLATNTSWSEKFDIDASVRATDYSTSGFVTTYKLGAVYQPNESLRFRLTRSQDIRAPNLAELYSAGSYGLASVLDPVTKAQVTPVGLNIGNPNLKPEVAQTTGAGVVFSPDFIPGFQASVDYYNISVGGAVGGLSGQQFVDQCYAGNPTTCPFITRNASGTITQITTSPVNISSLKVNGLDIEASYNMSLADVVADWGGDLDFRLLATRVFQFESNTLGVVSQGAGTNVKTIGGGAPHWRTNMSATYSLDALTSTLTVRYTSPGKYSNEWVACTAGCPLSTGIHPTYNYNYIASSTLLDLALNYRILEDKNNLSVYLNIDNLTNVNPPNIAGSIGGNYLTGQSNSLYDRIGRMFRAGVRFKL